MDLMKIIQDLRDERNKLEAIILSLEELQEPGPGRVQMHPSRRGRRSMDAEGRLEVSRRMKKYWESRRQKENFKTNATAAGHSTSGSMGA
jgi:hypothetical protein